MVYRFGTFELDLAKVELRADGELRSVEPQVFALLALLIENRERLISKEEIVEKVWDGRIVSDSAIASRIKSARKALGDDGKNQRYIKTIHGQGFRFVADARMSHTDFAARGQATPATLVADLPPRPSIAVLPFRLIGDAVRCTAIADGLPHEIISELSRLRWLFVTARGSSFRLRGAEADMTDIGRLLGVRYCLSGVLEVTGQRLTASIELVDTRDGGVVWAEHFHGSIDAVHQVREQIRARILVALEIQVPIHEAALARLTVTKISTHGQLITSGCSTCTASIATTTRLRKTCSNRLWPVMQVLRVRMQDFPSPTSKPHLCSIRTIGQAKSRWLGASRRAVSNSTRSTPSSISPWGARSGSRAIWRAVSPGSSAPRPSAQTMRKGFTRVPGPNLSRGERSRRGGLLTSQCASAPLDPLYYAMLGTRAFTHMMLGEDIEAADWAERAARSPGAHVLIALIAAITNALVDNHVRATWWADNVRSRNPRLTRQDFFRAFPMRSEDTKMRVANALVHLGF